MVKVIKLTIFGIIVLSMSILGIGIGGGKANAGQLWPYSTTWSRNRYPIGLCNFQGRMETYYTFIIKTTTSSCMDIDLTAYVYNYDGQWVKVRAGRWLLGEAMRISVDRRYQICYVEVRAEDTVGRYGKRTFVSPPTGAPYWY